MIALDDLPALVRKVEGIKQRRDEARGAVKQMKERFDKKFGTKTPKERKLKVRQLQTAERKIAVRYTKAKKRFETEYRDVLKET